MSPSNGSCIPPGNCLLTLGSRPPNNAPRFTCILGTLLCFALFLSQLTAPSSWPTLSLVFYFPAHAASRTRGPTDPSINFCPFSLTPGVLRALAPAEPRVSQGSAFRAGTLPRAWWRVPVSVSTPAPHWVSPLGDKANVGVLVAAFLPPSFSGGIKSRRWLRLRETWRDWAMGSSAAGGRDVPTHRLEWEAVSMVSTGEQAPPPASWGARDPPTQPVPSAAVPMPNCYSPSK